MTIPCILQTLTCGSLKILTNCFDVNLDTCSFFQWQDILQIIIPRSSALAAAAAGGGNNSLLEEGHTTCPICLSPPTTPRMTKCGHVSLLIRCCQSQLLTFILSKDLLFSVHTTFVVRSVSTPLTRNSSRASTGLLHLPTQTMIPMVACLNHHLHQSLLMTIRWRHPNLDQLCACGSCSGPR